MNNRNRLLLSFMLLGGVLLLGTFGYKILLPARTMLECFYATSITIATVGFEDVLEVRQGPATVIFTVILLFLGMGVLTFVVSMATAFIVEGDLNQALRRRKMERKITEVSGHYIVCGVGQTGIRAACELAETGRTVVAIDRSEERIAKLKQELPDVLYLQADAAEDEVLIAAGIERAHGLVSALSDDKDNVFVTLSARRLAPKMRIVARAIEERTVPKLRTAGADAVVSPNNIGAECGWPANWSARAR